MEIKSRYLCQDGPWAGHCLWLCTKSTAVLTIGNDKGLYSGDFITKNLFWRYL